MVAASNSTTRTVSRRAALATLGTASTAVAIPAAVLASAPTGDDLLLDLWNRKQALDREFNEAAYRAELIHSDYPEPPEAIQYRYYPGNGGPPQLCTFTRGELERYLAEAERGVQDDWKRSVAAGWRRKLAAMDEYYAARRATDEVSGKVAAERVASELCERVGKVEDAILATPAGGVLGVAVKLALWRERQGVCEFDADSETDPLVSALRDCDRLVGRLIKDVPWVGEEGMCRFTENMSAEWSAA